MCSSSTLHGNRRLVHRLSNVSSKDGKKYSLLLINGLPSMSYDFSSENLGSIVMKNLT